jgi:DNA-binding MarR family transcriptional regulator
MPTSALKTRNNSHRRDNAARAMFALRRFLRALRASDRAVEREHGVSATQLFVLRQLEESPGQSLRQLAAHTATGLSAVSELTSRLVEAGLVSRERSPIDARRVELRLTEAGSAVVAKAPQPAHVRILEALRRLPPQRQGDLAESLEAWLHQAGLGNGSSPPAESSGQR